MRSFPIVKLRQTGDKSLALSKALGKESRGKERGKESRGKERGKESRGKERGKESRGKELAALCPKHRACHTAISCNLPLIGLPWAPQKGHKGSLKSAQSAEVCQG